MDHLSSSCVVFPGYDKDMVCQTAKINIIHSSQKKTQKVKHIELDIKDENTRNKTELGLVNDGRQRRTKEN